MTQFMKFTIDRLYYSMDNNYLSDVVRYLNFLCDCVDDNIILYRYPEIFQAIKKGKVYVKRYEKKIGIKMTD